MQSNSQKELQHDRKERDPATGQRHPIKDIHGLTVQQGLKMPINNAKNDTRSTFFMINLTGMSPNAKKALER